MGSVNVARFAVNPKGIGKDGPIKLVRRIRNLIGVVPVAYCRRCSEVVNILIKIIEVAPYYGVVDGCDGSLGRGVIPDADGKTPGINLP